MSGNGFRLGLSLAAPPTAPATARQGLRERAAKLEDAGWDVILVPDHLPLVSPFPLLAALAAWTQRVRLGTLVVNNDWRSLAVLAQDAATVDLLSAGRLELGIGTGYAAGEYRSAGYRLGSGRERVQKLAATLPALRSLFAGERVSVDAGDVRLVDHELAPRPAQAGELPILVGGNGDRVLGLAARHADIVGFTGFGFPDGERPALTHLSSAGLADRVALFEREAIRAGREPERSLLVQVAAVGGASVTAPALARLEKGLGLDPSALADCPFLLVGEAAEVLEKIHSLRERFGVRYLTFLDPQTTGFEPLIPSLH